MTSEGYQHLSDQLDVSVDALRRLNVGWCGSQSFTSWPMRSASGVIVGIRTRYQDNSKKSLAGSDGNGLFFAPDYFTDDYLLICEGPTDAAALMDLGFKSVVGRPSCRLGNFYIIAIIRRLEPKVLLLIPDSDQAGLEGFADLAAEIADAGCIKLSRIDAITPPPEINDIRQWLQKNREHLAGCITAKLGEIKQRNNGETSSD
jgi:hypothetical protein